MDQVHVIRHQVLVEGRSQRSVAREHGVSRNTVRKYLDLSEPQRVESKPRRRWVTERVAPRLEELLGTWSRRTTAKQRLTASRVHPVPSGCTFTLVLSSPIASTLMRTSCSRCKRSNTRSRTPFFDQRFIRV